ncbi:SMI1/KNR4 family protein [Streptomyces sp. NPDC006235]|uniref:SMI1/KNR4 family protein n=1 Tax=Streptomyces sp. NPDC006235 TaxID=3156736 RepID=UPI0033A5EE15
MTAWDDLQRVMPPTAASDTRMDWDRVARSWGKQFPPDYRRFLDVYGAGSVEACLAVLAPYSKGESSAPGSDAMAEETANAKGAWGRIPKAPEAAGLDPALIAWGVSSAADILCWDTSTEDPVTWPLLVYNRDDNLWRRYDCGVVEFFVRVIRAEFDDCPLGDLSFWGTDSALFLNEAEQRRRLAQGLDPWTGEPDPYAGMSWS